VRRPGSAEGAVLIAELLIERAVVVFAYDAARRALASPKFRRNFTTLSQAM
jgi:hypothetical protein